MRLGIKILLFTIISFKVYSQDANLFNVDFGSILNNKNSIGVNHIFFELALPTQLKKGLLISKISYLKNDVNYTANETFFTQELERFHSIKYSLEYFNSINSNWSYKLNVSPLISSNFESNNVFNEVILNGEVIFKKQKNKGEFYIGVLYNSFNGFNFPIPTIGFSNQINPNLSYTLGVPLTKVEYNFNTRNKAKFYLQPKGFTANLGNKVAINTTNKSDKITYMSIISGFEFLHKIDDCWSVTLNAGHQLYSNLELLNNNKTAYDFNTKNNFYTAIQLKFNLLNKKEKNNYDFKTEIH